MGVVTGGVLLRLTSVIEAHKFLRSYQEKRQMSSNPLLLLFHMRAMIDHTHALGRVW